MMTILIFILGIVITLLLVIGIHEAGHFFVAKQLGVKVLRFSIGFGKALWRFHDKQGTEYVIAALPLGGYVKMLDESEGEPIREEDLPYAYNRQPFYKRFLIVMAGPFSNFLLAFILYWILFVAGIVTIKPVIGTITPHSIAAQAGLKPQQEIIAVDHHATLTWMAVLIHLLENIGDQTSLDVLTSDKHTSAQHHYSLDLTNWHLDELHPDPLTSIGILPYAPNELPPDLIRLQKYNLVYAMERAWQNTYLFTQLNVIFVGKIFTGKLSLKSLGGPITIFQNAGMALNQGYIAFLSFVAFLSISIGFINLLPIPGLDGGHLFLQIIEAVIGRPISPRIQLLLYRLGIVILLLLVIQALSNDITRLSH